MHQQEFVRENETEKILWGFLRYKYITKSQPEDPSYDD